MRDAERGFRLTVPALAVAAGEAVGLSGPSGTGKTLLLEVLGLVRRPDRAEAFRMGDIDIGGLWARGADAVTGLRGRAFGFVPQVATLLPFLDVAENVATSQRISGRRDTAWRDELIARLGLADVTRSRPGALSIGQRQRVAIGRALAHRPAVVLADEPTAALDPEAAEAAMALLLEAAEAGGSAVVLCSHDLGLMDRFPLVRHRLEPAPRPDAGTAASTLRSATAAEVA